MAAETDSSLTSPGPWPDKAARFLNRAALIAGPLETCGLILGLRRQATVQVHQLTHCANAAREAGDSFLIPAVHMMDWDRKAADLGLQIVGAWHSHPNGEPNASPADLKGLPEHWLGLIVAASADGDPRLQTYGRGGIAPAFVHV